MVKGTLSRSGSVNPVVETIIREKVAGQVVCYFCEPGDDSVARVTRSNWANKPDTETRQKKGRK